MCPKRCSYKQHELTKRVHITKVVKKRVTIDEMYRKFNVASNEVDKLQQLIYKMVVCIIMVLLFSNSGRIFLLS